MMRHLLFSMCLLLAAPLDAEVVIASRSLPARSVVLMSDIELVEGKITGHASTPEQVLGKELTSAIYAGRPFPLSMLASPAIIERNQIVSLVFLRGGLMIETDARALERGGIGARIRAMNMASRNTVFGIIGEDGRIHVGGRQ